MSTRGFQPKNGEIFNKGGDGPSVYNGFGTTRTAQSPTLFVTNLPAGITTEVLTALFALDPGFQQLRTVRHMIFVDFYDIRAATSSMRLHQNHKFEGHPVEQGLQIDYDKDARQKRNRAFTGQTERGAFSKGLDHEVYGAYGGEARGQNTMARPLPAAPKDPTLDLINKIKREHAEAQGVVVPLHDSDRTHARTPHTRPPPRTHGGNGGGGQYGGGGGHYGPRGGGGGERCFDFSQGRCDRGDACHYVHGGGGGGRGGGERCFDFSQGRCDRGDACHYVHGGGGGGRGGGGGGERCFDFSQGRCDRGDACRYGHGAQRGHHGSGNRAAKRQQPQPEQVAIAVPSQKLAALTTAGALLPEAPKLVRKKLKPSATAAAAPAAAAAAAAARKKRKTAVASEEEEEVKEEEEEKEPGAAGNGSGGAASGGALAGLVGYGSSSSEEEDE